MTRCFIVILCMLRGTSWSPPVMTLNLRGAISQQQRDLPSGQQSHSSTPHTDQQCVPLFLCFFLLKCRQRMNLGKTARPLSAHSAETVPSPAGEGARLHSFVFSHTHSLNWNCVTGLTEETKPFCSDIGKKVLERRISKTSSLKPHGVFM